MAEKNHPATPKRLKDAREQGQVAYSVDVAGALVFAVAVLALWLLGPMLFTLLLDLWSHATSARLLAQPDRHAEVAMHAAHVFIAVVLSVAALCGAAGVLGSFLQVGPLMAWKKLAPDVKRLNPVQGLQRIFSVRNLLDLAKTVFKVLLLGTLIFFAVRSAVQTALKLGFAQPASIVDAGGHVVLSLFAWAAVIFVLAGGADAALQHWQHRRGLRMSLEELRREHKDQQGDPARRAKRRSNHFEAVYFNLADRVRAASAVVHAPGVAVALQYLGPAELPRVIARAPGDFAAQVVAMAQAAGVQLVEDAHLAARLQDEGVQDMAIPRALYEPVTRLLGWAQADSEGEDA